MTGYTYMLPEMFLEWSVDDRIQDYWEMHTYEQRWDQYVQAVQNQSYCLNEIKSCEKWVFDKNDPNYPFPVGWKWKKD